MSNMTLAGLNSKRQGVVDNFVSLPLAIPFKSGIIARKRGFHAYTYTYAYVYAVRQGEGQGTKNKPKTSYYV